MNSFPKQVSIGGKTLNVVIDAEMENWGEYHYDKCEIRIAIRCLGNPKAFRDTLRHEMMHAALDIAGLTYIKNFEEEAVAWRICFFPHGTK